MKKTSGVLILSSLLCLGFYFLLPKSPEANAATNSCVFTSTKSLGFGASSNDIILAQKILNQDPDTSVAAKGSGAPGKETKVFGKLTKLAIKKFQNKNGLTVTGILDAQTKDKLLSLCNSSVISFNSPSVLGVKIYNNKTKINGVCGSANGGTFSSAPTTNLCSAGRTSAVTGSGPWYWSCAGINGGTTAHCSAQKTATTTPPPPTPTPTSTTSTPTPPPPTSNPTSTNFTANLIEDPGFESGTSNFETNQPGTSVALTKTNPIDGLQSLVVGTIGYGDSVLWRGRDISGFSTKRYSEFKASVRVRATVASASAISFCGVIDYVDSSYLINCSQVSGAVGDKGTVSLDFPLNTNVDLSQVRVGIFQEGSAALSGVMIDDAAVYLGASTTVSTTPPPTPTNGACGSANGGTYSSAPTTNLCSAGTASSVSGSGPWSWTCAGLNGGTTASCSAQMTANTTIPPPTVTSTSSVAPLASSAPRILLNDAATFSRLQNALNSGSAPAVRFKNMVDSELANPGTNYAFQAWYAALMYKLTGNTAYGTFAINKVDSFVASEETKINAGQIPAVAGDSYLEVGDDLGDIALTYDWVNNLVTASQKTRWINYMNTTLYNLWNPNSASWGGVSHPWSGWAIDDPFDNYYYSFLEATMLTGLSTYGDNPQAPQWLDQFYNKKVEAQLIPAMNTLPGGGSLEGTGYGTSLKRLFKLYFWWQKSTGIDIANQTPHTLGTMFWFMNVIVPSLDKIDAIGDQSRDSTAALYDYHRDLLQELISLYPNEPVAGAAKQLLAQSSVPQMTASFNYWSDFINDWPSVAMKPLSTINTAYYGTGTGNFFTRSSWTNTAIMVQTIAGLYAQSHAHRDQGSFMLNSAGEWMFDDANRRSQSGIEQDENLHNLVNFSAGGSVITQNYNASSQILALSDGPLFSYELMNITPMYAGKSQVVKSERELIFIKQGAVVVFDRASVNASSVSRVFNLQMATAPTISGNKLTYNSGSQRADVWRLSPTSLSWTTAALFTGVRAQATDNNGTDTLFLHVIGLNNQVTSAVSDNTATETGARITFSDGTVATIHFSNTGHGGTMQLVNGSGTTLYNSGLPTTFTTPPLYP